MKNNKFNSLVSTLSGRRSLRFQMVWTFLASIVASFLVSISIPRGLLFEIPISVIAFFGTFTISFLVLTRRTINYMQTLSEGLTVISAGNLHYRIPIVRQDELGAVAEHINFMAQKLESLIEKERQLERSKMELITGVSHDLRTPLTSIIGYLGLLKEKAYQDEAEYERFVGNTHNKAIQLKRLIDELFEYTRLTQSEIKLDLETIDLRELLNQMLVEIQPLAHDNEVAIESELHEQPLFIRADPERIKRAVDNLLINAVKFSIKPGVIRVVLTGRDKQVTLMVENEGEAITKDQEDRLFDRFYKADESRTKTSPQEGAGLGLAITRTIVERHGGRIYLDHSEGRFNFGVVLPYAAPI